MKKQMIVRFIVICICSRHLLHAGNLFGINTRGVYGNLEYGYMQENSKAPGMNIEQSTILQNYMLGMRGSVYSPNLLSYLLQGSFQLQDIDGQTNNVAMNSSRNSSNYRINTDFIRTTNYPVSFYTEKTSNPYNSIQGNQPFTYNEVSDRYGVMGSAQLPYFDLRYSAESSDLQRNETFAEETRKNTGYMVSLSKNFQDGMFSAVYNDTNINYTRDDRYFHAKQDLTDHRRDARIMGNLKIDKTLQLSSNVGYRENSYANLKNLSGNVNLNWNPNERYRASADVSANLQSDNNTSTNMVIVGGNSFYQMTPEFSTIQNVSLYQIGGNQTGMTMGMATIGGRYTKKLDNDVTVNGGADIGLRHEQHDVASDVNSSLNNRSMYTYTLTAGISKRMEALRSNISANTSYFRSVSTLDEKSSRLTANVNFTSAWKENISFSVLGYYYKENSLYFVGDITGLEQRNSEQLTVNNILRYWQDIGYNGRVSIGGGVMYTMTQLDQYERVNRLLPTVDGSLSYRFLDTLFLTSNIMASQDTVSDLTNYSGYVGLNYNLRKMAMSMGARHLHQTGGSAVSSSRNSFFFKISRPF